eukprot:922685-Pelagomonas_calceolata.AAC.3
MEPQGHTGQDQHAFLTDWLKGFEHNLSTIRSHRQPPEVAESTHTCCTILHAPAALRTADSTNWQQATEAHRCTHTHTKHVLALYHAHTHLPHHVQHYQTHRLVLMRFKIHLRFAVWKHPHTHTHLLHHVQHRQAPRLVLKAEVGGQEGEVLRSAPGAQGVIQQELQER